MYIYIVCVCVGGQGELPRAKRGREEIERGREERGETERGERERGEGGPYRAASIFRQDIVRWVV